MKTELDRRRKENERLKTELIQIERSKNIGTNGSMLLEKDQLRQDIAKLTSELVSKKEDLRRLGATYKTLVEDNNSLDQRIKLLQKEEPRYDQTILEYNKLMEEYEYLRNVVEENEFTKHEQLFLTQMKLEENSKKQMDFQIKELADKMAVNKNLTKEYLKKYIKRLRIELDQLG